MNNSDSFNANEIQREDLTIRHNDQPKSLFFLIVCLKILFLGIHEFFFNGQFSTF